MPADFDAIIVGAGLSGLVVAHALQRRGHRVAVIEASDRAGGVIGTRERDGFRYETGPNSALDNTPLLAALLDELGIADQRVDADPVARNRYVVRDGKLAALPTSPVSLVSSRALSMGAKFRLLRELFVPSTTADTEETIAAFARRRLGGEVLDYAVDPFVSGVYAGDPERLSVAAAMPRLHALEREHGSIVRGQFAAMRSRRDAAMGRGSPPRSFSFRGGMQVLVEALRDRVRNYAERSPATSIDVGNRNFVVSGTRSGVPFALRARAVVIATPADAAAAFVEPHDAGAAVTLRSLVYAPVTIVASAYRREDVEHPLDGFGMLVPSREHRRILGTLFSSSLFPERAPGGHVLLTTFIGGRRAPQLAAYGDEQLNALVDEELVRLLGARRPLWSEIVRWPRAIPQYEIGHRERVQRIEQFRLVRPGLFFCANWTGGVSIGDRVIGGEAVAAAASESLAAS